MSDQKTPLYQRIREAPGSVEGDERCARILDDIIKGYEQPQGLPEHEEIFSSERVLPFLTGVVQGSPYLTGLMSRDPARLLNILKTDPDTYFADRVDDLKFGFKHVANRDDAMQQLRIFKSDVALLCGLADLAGVWPVMHVTRVLTETADKALAYSIAFLFREAVRAGTWQGDPEAPFDLADNSGYFAIAMGKHGAYELNYSSDIDLIVLYEREIAIKQLASGQEEQSFFIRLTRDLVALMQDRTADGYVFRTDLRLRPDPSSTPAALPTVAALGYYETAGQNWERAAMIKARIAAGDVTAGQRFLDDIAPFIWRRNLDFASIADIHAMKRQIHAFRGFGTIAVAGHNIKLGRGGIREIEFFAQTQQLIAGGRQPDLRQRSTLDTLATLSRLEWISHDVSNDLSSAYKFLRRLEHRIQMVADEQTHTLPTEPEPLERLARFSGAPTLDKFAQEVLFHLSTVQKHYAALFEDTPDLTALSQNMVFAGADDDPATLEGLAEMGFSRAKDVIATVKQWHTGRYPAVRTPKAREILTIVQPMLIEALSETADPDRAFISFDRFLSNLPAGIQLFSLLNQHPRLLRLLADIMGTAPRMASILSRRHRLLDAVIDPSTFGTEFRAEELDQAVAFEIDQARDVEDMLDRARIVGSEQAFLIGIRILSGVIGAKKAGAAYARLAAQLIQSLMDEAQRDLASRHGGIPGGEAAVVAMGKLGGGEMTAASDLDLIVVYEFPDGVIESDGERPIDPVTYYTRLTQRLINMLSSPTVEGALYEVDLRLRPSGNQGPVATRLRSFVDYQANKAWTWEHMALTRAKVITGTSKLRAGVESAIDAALKRPRDRGKLVKDIHEMRALIDKEKGSTEIWDLKTVRGGLVDLEFIAQFLQLAHASEHDDVLSPNTIEAFAKLKNASILDIGDAELLTNATMQIHNLMQVLRLCLEGPLNPETAPKGLLEMLARAGGAPNFITLESDLKHTLSSVRQVYERIIT